MNIKNVNQKLIGKKALVTGSATGIGRAIALELARLGADVVVHSHRDDDSVRSVVAQIEALGRKSAAVVADFRSPDQVERAANRALESLGGIDLLVNNAGITFNRSYDEITNEQFDVLFNVNVRAPFFLTRKIAADMKTRSSGAICNIASIHALEGAPEHSLYAATKGAIVAWTRSLAIELAPHGIRVNAVAPGAVVVDSYKTAMPEFDEAELAANIPAGFVGKPQDVAQVVAFVLSDEARYILGQTLVVDGGTTAWMSFHDGFRRPSQGRFGLEYMNPL